MHSSSVVRSTSSGATCSTFSNIRTPAVTLASVLVVRREDYVYLVPFVEDEHAVFLKTIIPSRKATKEYLGEESDDHEDGR